MSIETLKSLSIEYQIGHRNTGDDERVGEIKLPFTAEQFMDVCSREGTLLPMCCGTISAMRDTIIGTLRDGGWIKVEDLGDLVGLMKQHEGFQELFDPVHREQVGVDDPFVRIALAWEALDDCMEQQYSHNVPRAEDPTDIRDATHLLSKGCAILALKDLFSRADYTEENYPRMSSEEREARNADAVFRHAIDTTTVLLRTVPAMRTLWARITEMYPEPVEGWAAVLLTRPQWVNVPDDRPGAKEGATKRVFEPNVSTDPLGHGIVLTAGGLAVYRTPEAFDEARAIWERTYPNIREMVGVRRVRVSPETGIEFLD